MASDVGVGSGVVCVKTSGVAVGVGVGDAASAILPPPPLGAVFGGVMSVETWAS